MSQQIIDKLKYTVHTCSKMPMGKSLLLEAHCIFELQRNFVTKSISGNMVDWFGCPYCGLEFTDDGTNDCKKDK